MSGTSHATIPQSLLGKVQLLRGFEHPSGGTAASGLMVHRKTDFGFAKDLLYTSRLQVGMFVHKKQNTRWSWLGIPTFLGGQDAWGILIGGDPSGSPSGDLGFAAERLARGHTPVGLLSTQEKIRPDEAWWTDHLSSWGSSAWEMIVRPAGNSVPSVLATLLVMENGEVYITPCIPTGQEWFASSEDLTTPGQTLFVGGSYAEGWTNKDYPFTKTTSVVAALAIPFTPLLDTWYAPSQWSRQDAKTIFIGGLYNVGWTNKDYSFIPDVQTQAELLVNAKVERILVSDSFDYDLADGGFGSGTTIIIVEDSGSGSGGVTEQEVFVKRNAWYQVQLTTAQAIEGYSALPPNTSFDMSSRILAGYCMEPGPQLITFTLANGSTFLLRLKSYLVERSLM